MGASIRLGRVLGIPISINYSWVVVFLLFTYLLGSQFSHDYPDWPLLQRWGIAAITTVLFFLSVLAHELSHSVVAVRMGIPVRGITLFIFGGVSHLAHEARRPLTEFVVAVVGPLSSVALGLIFWGLWQLLSESRESLAAICFMLFSINLSLGAFNMLPGFPLDGGRVLRAVVWGITGSYWRGTQVAARAGQVVGGLMVAGGVGWLLFGTGNRFQGLWIALIGSFLFSAASASYRQERMRETLKSHRVADAMSTSWNTLPGETPLASPLVAQALSGREDFVAVLVDQRVQGIVTRRSLARIPQGAWGVTSLAQAMLPLAALPRIAPEEPVFDALERMETENLDRLAVVRGEALLGILSRADLLRWLERGPGNRR
ncbi:MAG TPA: site-2 protease family protein [Dehalococcoidia bacterium]|nr:site-2 protease family protein [Dehalococcoidia bacterium]